MPLLNFNKQFASKVESGRKRCTIRRRRKRPIKPGDRLYLYTGLRTKAARKLGEGTCLRVVSYRRPGSGLWYRIDFDPAEKQERWHPLRSTALVLLAMEDGFETAGAFDRWFAEHDCADVVLDKITWRLDA